MVLFRNVPQATKMKKCLYTGKASDELKISEKQTHQNMSIKNRYKSFYRSIVMEKERKM